MRHDALLAMADTRRLIGTARSNTILDPMACRCMKLPHGVVRKWGRGRDGVRICALLGALR